MTTTSDPPAPRPKSNMAQIVSAVVAIVALAGIYVQVHLTRVNALRASARQVYLAYSQLRFNIRDWRGRTISA